MKVGERYRFTPPSGQRDREVEVVGVCGQFIKVGIVGTKVEWITSADRLHLGPLLTRAQSDLLDAVAGGHNTPDGAAVCVSAMAGRAHWKTATAVKVAESLKQLGRLVERDGIYNLT